MQVKNGETRTLKTGWSMHLSGYDAVNYCFIVNLDIVGPLCYVGWMAIFRPSLFFEKIAFWHKSKGNN